MNRDPIIWALIDERPGTGNQSKGVAMALGMPFIEKHLIWSNLAFLPNSFFGPSLIGLKSISKSTINSPWPDLVIASGRRAAIVARYIKRKNPHKCSLIHIMYPGDTAIDEFDIVAVPNHDSGIPNKKNIIRITGAPHSIDRNQFSRASIHWNAEFSNLKKPIIGLIVGGATKRRPFTQKTAINLGHQTANLVNKLEGSLIITTSPRSGDELKGVLSFLSEKNIKPAFVHQWRSDGLVDDNPYLGFLAHADHLIVTGESTSMCSEACVNGNIVHIFAPEGFLGQKHQRFTDELVSNGYAYLLEDDLVEFSSSAAPKKLDVAAQIAREIEARVLYKF
ncbi:MAG TPA: nucleoside-diphosphate sugar epimerase [Rhodospirillales bacterium]|nr:nucleoside-diphosphate sugar epimerase [Rhodospirillales bacterium]